MHTNKMNKIRNKICKNDLLNIYIYCIRVATVAQQSDIGIK